MTIRGAITELQNLLGADDIPFYYKTAIEKVIETIVDELPSADRLTIVRCKDCKWYGLLGCAIRIVDDSDKPSDNSFCSFGERREEWVI